MSKKVKKVKKELKKWWVKEPRSRRECFRCKHFYSSHIDVACLKIVQHKPVRKMCDCKGFISNKVEMEMEVAKQERKLNTLKEENGNTSYAF